jgi:hypothetical protein
MLNSKSNTYVSLGKLNKSDKQIKVHYEFLAYIINNKVSLALPLLKGYLEWNEFQVYKSQGDARIEIWVFNKDPLRIILHSNAWSFRCKKLL